MKHCKHVSVLRAQLDPDPEQEQQEQEEFQNFLELTVFRVFVAAIAVVKAI